MVRPLLRVLVRCCLSMSLSSEPFESWGEDTRRVVECGRVGRCTEQPVRDAIEAISRRKYKGDVSHVLGV